MMRNTRYTNNPLQKVKSYYTCHENALYLAVSKTFLRMFGLFSTKVLFINVAVALLNPCRAG